jgi:ankyrin repeat protein
MAKDQRRSPEERTQPAVVDAVLSGHKITVRILLERGSDIQGPHIEAGGLVSCAVETGQLAMLKLLIEFGADMNMPHEGVYSLRRAVCSRRLLTDIARFLLGHGAEITPIDEAHKPIMEQVVELGTVDTARLLLERGAIYPQDNLPYAVAYSSVDCIRLLIEYGIKPGIESLTRATKNKRLEIVQVLLEGGYDLNTRDSRGSTILHYALTQCGFESPTARLTGPICCVLRRRQLVRDMKVIPTQNVSSPCRIQEIQRDDAEEILRYLIDKGADVNAMDGRGQTPLNLAQRYAPAAKPILLANGAVLEREVI